MANITLRLVKGGPLTFVEADDNFSNIRGQLVDAFSYDSVTKLLSLGFIDSANITASLSPITDEFANYLALAGGIMTGNIDLGGNELLNGTVDSGSIPSLHIDNDTHAQLPYSRLSGTPTIGNGLITITAGDALTGGGTFNLNDSGPTTITIDFDSTTDITGNALTATTATNATNVNIADSIGETTGYIAMTLTNATGNVPLRTHPGLTFNGTGLTNRLTVPNLTVSGDLTVSGTTTTLNTQNLVVEDNIIVVNSLGTAQNAGLRVDRGASADKDLLWDETLDKWTVGAETFVAATFEGNLLATYLTGTIDSARIPLLHLANDTRSTIDFATRTTGDVALGTRTSGNYVQQGATGNGLTGSVNSEGGTFTVTMGTPSTLNNSSTNGTTASSHTHLIENLDAAQTTGGIFDSARIPGLSTADIVTGIIDSARLPSLDVTNDTHGELPLGTRTSGNYVASISNGSYLTGGDGGSEGAGLTLAVDATSANTASKVVARDGSGNFSAGTITAALAGNATSATNVTVTNNTSTDSSSFLLFVQEDTTGTHLVYTDVSTLKYNAADGELSATAFIGALQGNATTASAWATSRTVTFATGDVTGNFSIDGSGDVSNVNLQVGDDTHAHNANNLTGTTLNSGVVNSSLTSVGTLTSLTVSGATDLLGTSKAPNPAANQSDSAIATTAWVQGELGTKSKNVTITPTGVTMVAGNYYNVSDSGQTMTLPLSPSAGDTLVVSVRDFVNTTIGRNSEKIMGLDSDMTIDTEYASAEFVYLDAAFGWFVN